jgi:DNA-binding response OmpR family regulator
MSDINKTLDETARPVVLVLDDEQAYTKVMSMVLDEYGFDPVPANSAEDAWELLDRVTPDLVLLDVMMPKIDGITFLNDLRAHTRLRTVPVLVVTALPRPVRKPCVPVLQAT